MAGPQRLTPEQQRALDTAKRAHARFQAAQGLVAQAAEVRAEAIARAHAAGITDYRLAQELGVAPNAVRNARNRADA